LPIFARISTLAVVARPGTIAITDFDWYSYLSQQRSWDEVNFWKPTTTQPFRAPEFSPFFFKLKAPHRAIAGFGYFARYSELPEWLAWECFGTANGSASFEEMHARLERIRAKIKAAPQKGILQIGCIVVVNATFFSRDKWIPQPRDWAESNLRRHIRPPRRSPRAICPHGSPAATRVQRPLTNSSTSDAGRSNRGILR